MTTVAVCERNPLASRDVAEPEDSMPRNVRVSKRIWLAFSAAVGERKKSDWAAGFIDSVTRDPQLWKEFRALADARGDEYPDALIKAISLYNSNR